MTELTHVISSTPLTEEPKTVEATCPRELLGLACLVGTGYDCLCALVDSAEAGHNGAVWAMALNLTQGQGTPYAVMSALNLTGYVATFHASPKAVTATYDLRKPQNADLAAFVREAG